MSKIRIALYRWKLLLQDIIRFGRSPLILEIHAADHCNLNCMSCTHYSTVAKETYCDIEQLGKSLGILSRYDKLFGTINILGGEPLLNKNLAEIIEVCRKNFGRARINLVSNGLLLLAPEALPDNFWASLRDNDIVLKVTKYPININYEKIERVCSREGIVYEISKDCSSGKAWRKMMLDRHGKSKKRNRFTRLSYCYLRNNLQLVGDKIYPCAQMAYVHHLNDAFGTNFELVDADFVDVNKLKNSWQIRKLVLFSTPFCNYCNGDREYGEWRKSSGQLEEWVRN